MFGGKINICVQGQLNSLGITQIPNQNYGVHTFIFCVLSFEKQNNFLKYHINTP
jgi:hypothetical protein